MEGDRRITLMQPVRTTNELGEDIIDDFVEYVVWAGRTDRRGDVGIEADTFVGEWPTRFQIRQDPRFDLTLDWSGWQVRDELGRTCDVQAVVEPPFGRRRFWHLFCTAWTSGDALSLAAMNRILDGDGNFITDDEGNRLLWQ